MHHSFHDALVHTDPVEIIDPETKRLRSDRESIELGPSDETMREARDAWFSPLNVSVDDTLKNAVREACSPSAAYKAAVHHLKSTAKISIAPPLRKCSQRELRRGENPLSLWQDFSRRRPLALDYWRSTLHELLADLFLGLAP